MFMRSIALFFILCSVFVLASCTVDSPKNDTEITKESESVTETAETVPDIPNEKYDGYNFRVASTSDNTTFDIWRFEYEEQTGEIIEDAFYIRNLNIEERHDINFVAEIASLSQITKSISAGEDAYDIIFERASSLPSVISGGYLLELSDIPYLDLSWDFWDQNSISDLSIMNKIFIAAGDIHLSSFDCTWTLYFDKILIEDNNLENPYELIDSNKWTIEKFNDVCKTVSRDLDGNGIMDLNDFWGFSTHQGTYPGLITATGEKFISKDEGGIPYITMNTDKFYQAYIKILALMHNDNATYEQIAQMKSFSKNEQCDIFVEDRAVFFSEVMNIITTMLRNKKNDYSVVPWPKYDESQPRYNNYVHESAAMMAIPQTVSDLERTGIIIQDMAYESSKTIRPAYYETAILDKYSRDERMSEMLDIIFANRTYEIAFVYGFGGISNAFYDLAVKNNADLTSFIAKYETIITQEIEKFIEG